MEHYFKLLIPDREIDDKKTIIVKLIIDVIIVIVIYHIIRKLCKLETFDPNMQYEMKQEDIGESPQFVEPELKVATSASEFVGMPDKIYPAWGSRTVNYGPVDIVDDGKNGDLGLNFNLCSKSCCTPQWAPPFTLPDDDLVKNSKNKYVNTSYACNNAWQDSGCLCMTKEQGAFLGSRGGNAMTNMMPQ
jgi:hypothetical protein